jgi:hypothetical protein
MWVPELFDESRMPEWKACELTIRALTETAKPRYIRRMNPCEFHSDLENKIVVEVPKLKGSKSINTLQRRHTNNDSKRCSNKSYHWSTFWKPWLISHVDTYAYAKRCFENELKTRRKHVWRSYIIYPSGTVYLFKWWHRSAYLGIKRDMFLSRHLGVSKMYFCRYFVKIALNKVSVCRLA